MLSMRSYTDLNGHGFLDCMDRFCITLSLHLNSSYIKIIRDSFTPIFVQELIQCKTVLQRNCLGTIRNAANVCCVQFSDHSSHLLAFGSADYSTYCYDLRNLRSPWCVLAGHRKAVSYVKFLDSQTIVSASTDNTLKIWDLNKTSPMGQSTSASSLTLSGHTNEKVWFGFVLLHCLEFMLVKFLSLFVSLLKFL